MKDVMGTHIYMSPEEFKGEPHSRSSDIWSLGISFHEIISETHPLPIEIMNG